MTTFYQISFRFETPQARPETFAKIQGAVEQAKDWCRYAPNVWFIWTDLRADQWYEKLKPLLGPSEQILIIEVNLPNRFGWVGQVIVDWFNRDRLSGGRPGGL